MEGQARRGCVPAPMPFAIHDIRADAALPAEWCLELGVVVGMSRFHHDALLLTLP